MPVSSGTPKDIPTDLDPQEAFRLLSELFILTPKETEVFDKLVNSEENIQEIADGLYLSRRTCQRHIAAIYEKAGVKSRMGLYQLYIEKQRTHGIVPALHRKTAQAMTARKGFG